jgi:hypothetical protein
MADYMTVTACVDFLRTPKDKGGAGLDDADVFEILCTFIQDLPDIDPETEFFAHVATELGARQTPQIIHLLPSPSESVNPAAPRRRNQRKVRAHGSQR